MAASTKKKVSINKDDLKRLMREKQSNLKAKKTIDSPLAKYNSAGQLSCALCNQPVKSELLWNAHIQGRTHKETVTRLKAEKSRREEAIVQPKKRKQTEVESSSNAKVQKGPHGGKKSSLPSDFFDSKPSVSSSQPKGILKTSKDLSLGDYQSSSSEDEEEAREPVKLSTETDAAPSELPPDFFDQGIAPSASSDAKEEKDHKEAVMSEKIPEGFFDDPKKDAKAREIEYKDKMDVEWDLFQRAMQEENHVSEAIIQEDDEELIAERSLVEIEEQMCRWTRVNELEKKKEKLMKHDKKEEKVKEEKKEEEEEEEDIDEEDLEDFLDWRTKKL